MLMMRLETVDVCQLLRMPVCHTLVVDMVNSHHFCAPLVALRNGHTTQRNSIDFLLLASLIALLYRHPRLATTFNDNRYCKFQIMLLLLYPRSIVFQCYHAW